MRALVRAVLLCWCVEFMVLARRGFGFGFCLLLALAFVVKQQVLIYLPVSLFYQQLHQYAALALGVHLLGRFFLRRMAFSHAGLPPGAQGTSWLCFLGVPERWARRYGEPFLVLGFAVWAAGSAVFLRFRPLLRWEFLPLPYGVSVPFPAWYREYAVLMAHGLPLLSALALALFNRLGEPRQANAPAMQEEALTFSEVALPEAPRLPVPSASAMALGVERKTP